MKKAGIIISSIVALAFTYVQVTNWNVNVAEAKISFDLPQQNHKGVFKKMTSDIIFDSINLEQSKINAIVDVASIDANNEQLSEHLRAKDFFYVEKFPNITFHSEKFTKTEKGFNVLGKLNIKDSTKLVNIPFTFDENASKGVFKGSFSIYAGDYGVTKKSATGKDIVVITLEVPVTK